MGQWARLRQRLLSGQSDQNIPFNELIGYLLFLGFAERIRGDHHILTREGVAEIINLQPRPDGKAKPYQVRQARAMIVRYKLGGEDD